MTNYSSARRPDSKPPATTVIPAGAWVAGSIVAGLVMMPVGCRLLSGRGTHPIDLMFPISLAVFSFGGAILMGVFGAWFEAASGRRPGVIVYGGGGFILFCLLAILAANIFPTRNMAARQARDPARDAPKSVASNTTNSGRFVIVTADSATVHFGPSMSSDIVANAKNGDIFKRVRKEGDWFTVFMFSGEYRYIFSPMVKETSNVPPLTTSPSSRKAACIDLVRAEDRATEEAYAKFPSDIMKEIDYQRILQDRYSLVVFQAHGIATPHNGALVVECVKNDWVPR